MRTFLAAGAGAAKVDNTVSESRRVLAIAVRFKELLIPRGISDGHMGAGEL